LSVTTVRVERRLTCNGQDHGVASCTGTFTAFGTAAQVRALAKRVGWSVGRPPGGMDFCPRHRSGILANLT
jgi:hypothetical protein